MLNLVLIYFSVYFHWFYNQFIFQLCYFHWFYYQFILFFQFICAVNVDFITNLFFSCLSIDFITNLFSSCAISIDFITNLFFGYAISIDFIAYWLSIEQFLIFYQFIFQLCYSWF